MNTKKTSTVFLLFLLLFSMVAVLFSVVPMVKADLTFGNTATRGGTESYGGTTNAWGSSYTLSDSNANVTSLSATGYHWVDNSHIKLALYNTTTLLGQTSPITVHNSSATYSGSVSITGLNAGTYYIMVMTDDTQWNNGYDAGGAGQGIAISCTYPTFPSDLSSEWTSNSHAYEMYATYTIGGGGGSTTNGTISKSGATYTYTDFSGTNHTDTTSASRLINQAWLDASTNSSGLVIILPASYYLNETVVQQSNIFVNATGATFYHNAPSILNDSYAIMSTPSVINNFTLNGGTWNGNKGALSDHRGSGTWSSNFYKYFGFGFVGLTNNVLLSNLTLENVIGQGIYLHSTTNSLVHNASVLYAGDNPITLDAAGGANTTNNIIEYCTVVGGQDVGINTWITFDAGNIGNIIRYNSVTNVTQYAGDASHWGIGAEGSNNVDVYGNTVTNCSQDIVLSGNNNIAENNTINGLGFSSSGIQVQTASGTQVINNTVSGCTYPLSTYGPTGTIGVQFINNTCTDGYTSISGKDIYISGGIYNTTDGNGGIAVDGARNVTVYSATFLGVNGFTDRSSLSIGVNVSYSDFSALSGTRNSTASCENVTFAHNIGVADYSNITYTVTPNYFGYSEIGGSNAGSSGVMITSNFTLSEARNFTSIDAYLAVGGGGNAKAVIYAKNGTSLANSTVEAVSNSAGWINFPLTSYIILQSGEYYLGLLSDGYMINYYDVVGTQQWWQVNPVTYPNNPSTFTPDFNTNYEMSIYAINVTLTLNQYSITVTSTYGNPTSSAIVTQGDSYATSVTSPVSVGVGIREVCTRYSVDGGGNVFGTNYTFTNVQANHTITYSWQTQYYLTVTSTHGSPQGEGWYAVGATAPFNVTTPFSGGIGIQYVFTSWTGSGAGAYSGSSSSYSVTMNDAVTETASWQTQYYLTPSNDTNSAITPSSATWVNSGASQTFNYSASIGHSITSLYIDGNAHTPIGTAYTFTNVQAPHTITVFSSAAIPPVYSSVTASSTTANQSSIISVTVNDAVALQPNGRYQFGTNNTGSWIWQSLVNFTSTPQTLSITITLNDTVGVVVACQFNCTDNALLSSNTGIQILTTEAPVVTPTPTPTS